MKNKIWLQGELDNSLGQFYGGRSNQSNFATCMRKSTLTRSSGEIFWSSSISLHWFWSYYVEKMDFRIVTDQQKYKVFSPKLTITLQKILSKI